MAEVRLLGDVQTWRQVVSAGGPLVVFKHSTACPISAEAAREFWTWSRSFGAPSLRLYVVRVREAAPLSRRIAVDTGIAHRSPQVLYLRGGRVVWHASHTAITVAALRRAIG